MFHGTVIPEDTVRKQLPRHILPSEQYLATVNDDPGKWFFSFILHQLIKVSTLIEPLLIYLLFLQNLQLQRVYLLVLQD